MIPLAWKEPVVYFGAGILFMILVYRARLLLRLYHSRYLKTWRQFAKTYNMQLTGGSLLETPITKAAQIKGQFCNREVTISADPEGRIGFWHVMLNVQMAVDNPSSARLPVGAFLHIRRHPRLRYPFYRLQTLMGLAEPDGAQIGGGYVMQSIPVNLGNHLHVLGAIDRVLDLPGMHSLVIERQKLRYALVGLPAEPAAIETLMNDISDLAEHFERFVRNWL